MTSQRIQTKQQAYSKHWTSLTRTIEHGTGDGRFQVSRRLQGASACQSTSTSEESSVRTSKLGEASWERQSRMRGKKLLSCCTMMASFQQPKREEGGEPTGGVRRGAKRHFCAQGASTHRSIERAERARVGSRTTSCPQGRGTRRRITEAATLVIKRKRMKGAT